MTKQNTRKIFITATDTDAGKTYVTNALTLALVAQQQKVAVFKPISAGCEQDKSTGELVNQDAQTLQQSANCGQSIKQINPISFQPAIAPHLAAILVQQTIAMPTLIDAYQQCIALDADWILSEGAGGWRLPLGNGLFLSDFAKVTQQQVILVVNMKLGCLNHALLTHQAIKADGLTCIAWVANCQTDMPFLMENISALAELLPCPLLATLPCQTNAQLVASQFELSILTEQ